MALRIQHVTFTKEEDEEQIVHHANIVTYADEKKRKLVSLLTNDFDMTPEDIIAIYRQCREIELLQTDKAKLTAALLLRGEWECHQDTNLGDTNRQHAANPHAEVA